MGMLHGSPVPCLARWLLGLGIAATLTANMAQGWSHGPVGGAAVAAWPAVSLVGSCAPGLAHPHCWDGGTWSNQVSTQPRPTAGTMAGTNWLNLPRKDLVSCLDELGREVKVDCKSLELLDRVL